MDPELQKLYEAARDRIAAGVPVAKIDEILRSRIGKTWAELEALAQPQGGVAAPPVREEPVFPTAGLVAPRDVTRTRADTGSPPPAVPPSAPKTLGGVSLGRLGMMLAGGGNPVAGALQAPTPSQQQSQMDAFLMALKGASVNTLEELGALPALAPGGQTFGEARRALEQRTGAAAERLGPGGSIAAQMAGGAMTGLGAGRLLTAPAQGIGRIGQGFMVGLGEGTLAGAAEAPELEDVPQFGAAGGVIGGLLGGGIPVSGELLRAGGRTARGIFAPQAAGQAAAARSLAETELTPQQIRFMFHKLRQGRGAGQAIVADVDERLGQLLREIRNRGGARAQIIKDFLRQRAGAAGMRLTDDLRDLTDVGGASVFARRQAVKADLQSQGALFDHFKHTDIDMDAPELQVLFNDPDVGPLWNRIKPKGGTDFERLHQLRRRIRGDASQAYQSGNGALGADLNTQANFLDDFLDNQAASWRAVNRGYAQTSRVAESFEEGANAFQSKMSVDEMLATLKDLELRAGARASEVAAGFRHGFFDEATIRLLETGAPSGAARRTQQAFRFNARSAAKVKALFPDDARYREFLDRLLREEKFSVTWSHALGNSTTAQQQNSLLRGTRQAQVQGPAAAVIEAVEQGSSDAVQKARVDYLADLLLGRTPADANRLALVLARGKRVPNDVWLALGLTPPLVDRVLNKMFPHEPQIAQRDATQVFR